MSPAISFMFVGVAAAMFGAGATARRTPGRDRDARLFFTAGALFLLGAFAFLLTYLFD